MPCAAMLRWVRVLRAQAFLASANLLHLKRRLCRLTLSCHASLILTVIACQYIIHQTNKQRNKQTSQLRASLELVVLTMWARIVINTMCRFDHPRRETGRRVARSGPRYPYWGNGCLKIGVRGRCRHNGWAVAVHSTVTIVVSEMPLECKRALHQSMG